eukprot:4237875-Amphidinium_carterae.1
MSVVIEEVMEILREYDLSESVPSDSMDAYMEGDLTPKALERPHSYPTAPAHGSHDKSQQHFP